MILHPSVVKIVHMGDSITYGQYVDAALRWTTLAEERLGSELADEGIRIDSRNSGVSGNTTRMGLERFPTDVQEHLPDVVTIQFGMNDCNCWATDGGHPRVSPDAFMANLHEMIARVRKFDCRHIVIANNHCTLRREQMVSGEVYELANERYSQLAESVAAEAGVTFCDVRSAFEPFSPSELGKLLLPAPDRLHLSVEGNRLYAEVIHPYIRAAVLSWVEESGSITRTGA
jgi:lysophospholipase L1-like esterase